LDVLSVHCKLGKISPLEFLKGVDNAVKEVSETVARKERENEDYFNENIQHWRAENARRNAAQRSSDD
jgi:hypothetical protein